MAGYKNIMLDPRYSMDNDDESTIKDDSGVPFGANKLFGQGPAGLVGLDPRMVQDPRFTYSSILRNGIPTLGGIDTSFSSNPRFLRDIDDRTLANDMYAIAAGHKGTSEGDESSDFFTDAVRRAMGNQNALGPHQVNFVRQLLRESNFPEFRQTHPGKSAFTPKYDKDRR
jgi:hypothetical protein